MLYGFTWFESPILVCTDAGVLMTYDTGSSNVLLWALVRFLEEGTVTIDLEVL